MSKPKEGTRKRIYIAGPMSGLPQFNFPAFDAARDRWQRSCWEVVSPADMDRAYWRETFGEEFDVNNPDPRIVAGGDIYDEFLRMDIAEIAQCSAIALLPGWEKSKGVAKELTVARLLKLDEFDAVTMLLMATQTPEPVASCTALPTDPSARKAVPLARGCLDYFPAALAAVAEVSLAGSLQHGHAANDMYWERGKSSDHADCAARHILERGTRDVDTLRHSAKAAWRVLALLQEELEAEGAPLPRGARLAITEAK